MKLIIQGYNKSLHKNNNQLIIKEKQEEKLRITPKKISDITINSKGYITFDALTLISQYNIPLIAINNYGQIEYILQTPQQENITLKKQQYKYAENKEGLKTAKNIIKAKIKNQHSTLKTLNKNKKISEVNQIKKQIKQNIKQIDKIPLNTEQIYTTKNKIMGIEGQTSTQYWRAITYLTPKTINFKTRKQKPTNDILNAMLNYGYAILASEITKNIILQKLDPYCGILHADLNKRTSLTYDIIEEFRQQIIDKTVIGLINNKQITEQDIDKRNNQIKTKPKNIIIDKIMKKIHTQITYQNQTTTYKEIIEQQTKKLKQSIIQQQEYQPFYINW